MNLPYHEREALLRHAAAVDHYLSELNRLVRPIDEKIDWAIYNKNQADLELLHLWQVVRCLNPWILPNTLLSGFRPELSGWKNDDQKY